MYVCVWQKRLSLRQSQKVTLFYILNVGVQTYLLPLWEKFNIVLPRLQTHRGEDKYLKYNAWFIIFYRFFPWTWIKMSTKCLCVWTKLKWYIFNLENFVIVSISTLHRILCKINHWYCMEAVGHIFVVAHQREAIKDLVWNTLGASRHTILSEISYTQKYLTLENILHLKISNSTYLALNNVLLDMFHNDKYLTKNILHS